jgi:hypothetical protein
MTVQDTASELYEKGKALVVEGYEKGKRILVDNADKITETVDNVGGFIDDKTGHKYTETITKGVDVVKSVIPTADEPAAPEFGAPEAPEPEAPEAPTTPSSPTSD